MILNLDEIMPGMAEKMHDKLHLKYGVQVGLFKEQYRIFFDPDPEVPDWDVKISAGKVVHILLRTAPWFDDFDTRLRLALVNHKPHFRAFLRSATEDKKDNAWEGLITKYPEVEDKKKVNVNAFARQVVISVRLIDKKTKKIVEVITRNGDVFTAQEMALKQLYGERFETEI